MRHLMVSAFVALSGAALVAQSQPNQSSQQSTAPRANQTVTVTGCVEAGPNNTFTLVAAPPSGGNSAEPVTGSTATTPAGSKVAKTITYTLAGPYPGDLQSHVGHTVAVTGIEAPPQVVSQSKDTRAGEPNAQGTSGTNPPTGAKPNVQTTEQTQIVARQLTVSSVKMVSDNCQLIK
jgi:hypothetical protein